LELYEKSSHYALTLEDKKSTPELKKLIDEVEKLEQQLKKNR